MIQERYYQTEAENAVFDYFINGGTGNPLVAMPTATGKSVVIAKLIRRIMYQYPNQRLMMLTHVKELIQQNANKLLSVWPDAPLGIFSAGLNSRNSFLPIVFGGVGSVVSCVEQFGHRDLLFIDEAHLLAPSDNTMYRRIIEKLRQVNPYLKVVGFTATPYRLGQGLLTDDGLFTDICYDITGYEAYNKLVEEGYLALLIPKPTETELDIKQVHLVKGDFNQAELEAAINQDGITYDACCEIVRTGTNENRWSWLIFAAGVKHSDSIALMLQSFGIDAVSVHSKMPTQLADQRIAGFRAGQYRCIVNYGKLTTGFDHPPIDLIGDMRPTMSPGLHVQKLGRGGRPSPETLKTNCLVLDFARNVLRLGPVNDPVIPRKKKKGDPGTPPVKICPACGVYNHTRVTHCIGCGYEFPSHLDIVSSPGNAPIIRMDQERQEAWYKVDNIVYLRHQKSGGAPMIQVNYYCGYSAPFKEFVCIEHGGRATKKAFEWWMNRGGGIPPKTTDEALSIINERLQRPTKILVWTNLKYPTVMSYEF